MSASVSKIPVAKHRRLSPDRPSPVMSPGSSPQKLNSKLPVRVGKIGNESPGGQYKENICDYRPENVVRWNEQSPVTSPSRIPVKSNESDTPRILPSSAYRPQSIDLEDEYVIGKHYGVYSSPDFQQVRKKSDPKISTSPRKISPLAAQVPNSRIPIANEYYYRSDRQRPSPPRSISSSSLKMSPASQRLDRDESEHSLVRARSSDQLSNESQVSNEQLEEEERHQEVYQPLEYSPPKPRRSSVPAPPKSQLPVVGWSLPPERQEEPQSRPVAEKSDPARSRSSLPVGTSKYFPNETGDHRYSDSSNEQLSGSRGKRQFEAFVMTGDRMINLAKTPAHSEFRSKYYRPPAPSNSSTSVPTSPIFDDDGDAQIKEKVDQDNKQVKHRVDPVQRRSFVRTSKSEDQLQMEPQDVDELDISASVHTLLNGSSSENSSTQKSSSSPQSRKKSPPKHLFKMDSSNNSMMVSQTSSQNSDSPDFSTSSLISCSEHYNGESVLDNISPKTPSSPETPEWSLIDSFHKTKTGEILGGNGKKKLSPLKDVTSPMGNGSHNFSEMHESVTSSGNRVVITINNGNGMNHSNGSRHVMSPGGSSTGTITPEIKNYSGTVLSDDEEEYYDERCGDSTETESHNNTATAVTQVGFTSSPHSESDESDMESLRSFHPPVKVVDIPSAVRLAKRLFNLEGFKKSDVSRHLSRNNEFNQVVAEEYLKFFNFNNCSLDIALRQFLSRFCLAGETQERERVLLHFARRYVKCNPSVVGAQRSWFRSLDSVHTLTCAIMLLNTDLHGETLQRKMTCNEFIENLSELNDGQNFPKELLKGIYYAIKQESIPWASDVESLAPSADLPPTQPQKPARLSLPSAVSPESQVVVSEELSSQSSPTRISPPPPAAPSSAPIAIGKTAGGVNPFLSAPDPETASNYKKGYVMRKSCVDPNGKKTKLGKRSWKMYFMTLRDMVLYCFKDEKSLRVPGAFDDLSQAIRIHHGLAVRSDHRKKQFVFRLYTADQAQYLFQTSDEKELLTWIDSINAVVASFSAPQLPAPCSSAVGRFQRPLMPSSKSSLNFVDQLQAHERQLLQIRQELEYHLQTPPSRQTKGAALHAYTEKEEFLTFEIMRYETYILTLRTKNAHDA